MPRQNITDKIMRILTMPQAFFRTVAKETIAEPLQFSAVLALVFGTVGGIVTVAAFEGFASVARTVGFIGGFVIGYFIGTVVIYFILAAILHVAALLLGGKGGYAASYKAYAYGGVPSILFSWLPVSLLGEIPDLLFGLVLLAWTSYIAVHGVAQLHKLSLPRSAGVVVLTLAFVALVLVALMIYVGMTPGLDGLLKTAVVA